MSLHLLVHGAWHGSWCWDQVVTLLNAKGYKAMAIDLPGRGANQVPIEKVTLESCVKYICDVLDAQPEQVILVGHSLGGVIITEVAEHRPLKIQALVYVAAYLPHSGESATSLGSEDTQTMVPGNLILSSDQKTVTVKESLLDYLYTDCPEATKKYAASRLVPEFRTLTSTPVTTTVEKFDRVRRFYISTLRDKIISPQLQQKMYKKIPCEKVITIYTGHSPFFSTPEDLVSSLISVSTLSSTNMEN
jgi:pimeloyl-ACP methyl ester carboxylesterase